jgi:hypothetical protein
MNNLDEFKETVKTQSQFWTRVAPVCIVMLLLIAIVVSWGIEPAVKFRKHVIYWISRPLPRQPRPKETLPTHETRSTTNVEIIGTAAGGSAGNLGLPAIPTPPLGRLSSWEALAAGGSL